MPGPTVLQRLDSWFSTVTGLGGARDKRKSYQHTGGVLLDQETLRGLYEGNDLAATICDAVPEGAFRQGFEIKIPDDRERVTALHMRLDELDAAGHLLDAACWGNAFGACALLLGVDDGQAMDKPLRPDFAGVKKLSYVTTIEPRYLSVQSKYKDPVKPKFGEPEVYLVSRGGSSVGTPVHETRLLFFYGARTSRSTRDTNQGWPLSRLQRVYDVLRDFGVGWDSVSLLLQEASQAVYGVEDLVGMLTAEGGEDVLRKRFQMIEEARSVAKAMVIDKEETFERKATSFAGVPDILDRFSSRLAAAARMPVTVLMGVSPGGLNATGASDIRMWYDQIRSWQRDELKPALETLIRILLVEAGAKEPEEWSVCFAPLEVPSQAELATMRKTVADTDAVYIAQGVYTPEECALSRFTAEGWSMETTIDLDLRKELEDAHEEKALAQLANEIELAKNPPAPGAVGPDGKPLPPGAPAPGAKPGKPGAKDGRENVPGAGAKPSAAKEPAAADEDKPED